jgi:hypothetical protein
MGVDLTSFNAILHSLQYVIEWKQALTLGRQEIHRPPEVIWRLLRKYNKSLSDISIQGFVENMFTEFGFGKVDSLDANNYEGASIIHDMNFKISDNLRSKYNYIYDGGTTEHIFNIPRVLQNVIDMLAVGGIYCSVTCNNNFSGHGLYQFSPELFYATFCSKYGMRIIDLFIAENETEINNWLSQRPSSTYANGRNLTKFDSFKEIYIIIIAQKISEDYELLSECPPQQYSYASIDWI